MFPIAGKTAGPNGLKLFEGTPGTSVFPNNLYFTTINQFGTFLNKYLDLS